MTTFIRKYKVTMEPIKEIQVEIPVEVDENDDCEKQKCSVCFFEHSEKARQEFVDNIDDYIESANIVVVADVDGELKDEYGEGLIDNPVEINRILKGE